MRLTTTACLLRRPAKRSGLGSGTRRDSLTPTAPLDSPARAVSRGVIRDWQILRPYADGVCDE